MTVTAEIETPPRGDLTDKQRDLRLDRRLLRHLRLLANGA
jgi:hypothetical protein